MRSGKIEKEILIFLAVILVIYGVFQNFMKPNNDPNNIVE
tara:strand:+ start:1355 stop:1474 length:120 start_codon:yes stop_codon:yes gene_type:complete